MKIFGQLVKEFFTFIVLAVLIVLPIRIFIAQPFIVEGESMHPTFENADYLIVDELTYRFQAPKRGDVITFRYPGDPSIFYIKRIIGLPGETVAINGGVVTVTETNGETLTLSEPYIAAEDVTYTKTTSLSADQYFVMGDNRPNSSDSRVWGPLPKSDIIGHVVLRLLPPNMFSLLPGKAAYANPTAATTTP